jgi:hypothetical protein
MLRWAEDVAASNDDRRGADAIHVTNVLQSDLQHIALCLDVSHWQARKVRDVFGIDRRWMSARISLGEFDRHNGAMFLPSCRSRAPAII